MVDENALTSGGGDRFGVWFERKFGQIAKPLVGSV
jgi:hypothetical protein